VLVPGAKAPRLISRDMLRCMRPGSVLVDIAIDQGGCAETSRPTTHDHPVFVEEGVTHYCVANMPGAYARTATQALTNVTHRYVEMLADHGVAEACRLQPALAGGINIQNGRITCLQWPPRMDCRSRRRRLIDTPCRTGRHRLSDSYVQILGADGKEYGPVANDQIKKWIVEGRRTGKRWPQQIGEPGWKPLGQFAEFADVLGVVPPQVGATPPPAGPAAAIATPTTVGAAPAGADPRDHARAQQMIAGPAIALMVTAGLGIAIGLLGLVQILSGMGGTPDLPGLDPEVVRMIRLFTHGPIAVASMPSASG